MTYGSKVCLARLTYQWMKTNEWDESENDDTWKRIKSKYTL